MHIGFGDLPLGKVRTESERTGELTRGCRSMLFDVEGYLLYDRCRVF